MTSRNKQPHTGALATLLKVGALGAAGLVVMFFCVCFCRSACNCIREEDQARRVSRVPKKHG